MRTWIRCGGRLGGLLPTAVLAVLIACPAAASEYSLSDLYRIALVRSEKIRISEENLFLAEAGKDKKKAALLPRLSTYSTVTDYTKSVYSDPSAAYPYGMVIQPNNMITFGARVDHSITLNGKEITDFNIARDNIAKQRNDINALKEEYMMTVATRYYEALRAKKSLDIADATVERLTAYRSAADKRLRIGEVTRTVLLRADGELSGALSEQIKARNALELTKAILGRVVGLSERDFILRESFEPDGVLPPLEDYLKVAYIRRAEMKSVEVERQMAKDAIRVAKGGYWPTLAMAGVYSRLDQDPVAITTNRESVYAQMTLNFPFYEGGLREAEVREAIVRDRQADLKLADLKKTIHVEVETAYLEMKNQRGIIKSLQDQLAFAKDNYKAVTRQFEYGLANSIDVLDANTLLVSTERQLANAVYSHQVFQLMMKRATGILLAEILPAPVKPTAAKP